MTIETEVAALTVATNDLLAAVAIRKSTLDFAVETVVNAAPGYQAFPDMTAIQASVQSSAANALTSSRAKAAAEAARDAANSVGKVFTSTVLGIAGTASGQSFCVLSADLLYLIIYTNNAGIALEVTRYGTKAFIDSRIDAIGYAQSGYAWAVVDSLNRIALYIDSSGAVGLPGLPNLKNIVTTLQAGQTEWDKQSGYAWGVMDVNRRLPLGLDLDGNLISKGVNISNPGKTIACWGDSLTGGSGGTPYPAQLAALYGTSRSIFNFGVGGDTSEQVATRQGGKAPLLSVAGNQIPASGSVTVTPSVTTLIQSGQSLRGGICGIPGTLTNTGGVYSFVRQTAGSILKVDGSLYFDTSGGDFDTQTVVIWVGQNDTLDASGSSVAQASVAAMVAFLKSPAHNRRFVVLSVPGSNMGSIGQSGYIRLIAHNNALRDTYPRNYIDVRALLIRNYNAGIPQDVTDFNNDIVPSSLRSDAVHLNTAGYALVAQAVKSFFNSKGW